MIVNPNKTHETFVKDKKVDLKKKNKEIKGRIEKPASLLQKEKILHIRPHTHTLLVNKE